MDYKRHKKIILILHRLINIKRKRLRSEKRHKKSNRSEKSNSCSKKTEACSKKKTLIEGKKKVHFPWSTATEAILMRKRQKIFKRKDYQKKVIRTLNINVNKNRPL